MTAFVISSKYLGSSPIILEFFNSLIFSNFWLYSSITLEILMTSLFKFIISVMSLKIEIAPLNLPSINIGNIFTSTYLLRDFI